MDSAQKLWQLFEKHFADKELQRFMPSVRPELVEGCERRIITISNDPNDPKVIELDGNQFYELSLMVEEGASVTIHVKRTLGAGAYRSSLAASIGKHARVIWIEDQELGPEALLMTSEAWSLAKNSQVTTITGLTGGKQSYAVKDFILEDDTARIEHLSIAALKDSEQAALITRQQHRAKATQSSVHVKTLLLGDARSFYRGTITMNEDAVQANADQQQRALMLSDNARVCAIPSLEVATHDVQCRHGSAAARFNKEELWYLLSRGFDEQGAVQLLIEGFYNEHPLITEHGQALAPMLDRMKARSQKKLAGENHV